MIGRIYVGYHQTLLHTKIQALGLIVSDKEIILIFSYCKSTGDDDPRGLANFDLRGMIGKIYVGYH